MTSTNKYKSGLTVGGSALDKSKLQLRRPTPDSDALVSSDDDREHMTPVVRPSAGAYHTTRRPSATGGSGGWIQDIKRDPNERKFSLPSVSFAGSQPTTPALELPQQARPGASNFPWNTSSFSSMQSSSRLKEVLPSPTSAHPPNDKGMPSPTTFEGDDGIGFLLNQQNPSPIRKAVRSQSYSIGQGDIEHSPVGQFSARLNLKSNLRHRPSKPSLLGEPATGLSQLKEDEADEVESSNGSQQGIRLPADYWERENKQALLKQTAVENAHARARMQAGSSSSPVHQQRRKTTAGLRNVSYGNTTEYAIEELDDQETPSALNHPTQGLLRRFSEHVSTRSAEPEPDTPNTAQNLQWSTINTQPHIMDPLGRRHSIAHYGSYNSGMPSGMASTTLGNTQEEDEELVSPREAPPSPSDEVPFDPNSYFSGYGPVSRAINNAAISAAHPDPLVPRSMTTANNPYAVPPVLGRPGRHFFVVTFKCSRADVYYTYDNTGLEIRAGDLVITEGDRGCDLGQVSNANVTLEEAKKIKAELNEEHFRWLVLFSGYAHPNTQENGMLGSLSRAYSNGRPNPMSRPQSGIGAQQDPDTKPKMIRRLAQQHEIMALREKEGQESKAKRLGAQKAADHNLPMEILDAEYQADYHKLTYFYYAETYVNFNELVTDLFKQYKVRIWMSAVNPASVVNPAGMRQLSPPSAIGPGAILNSNTANNTPLPVGPGFGSNTQRPNEQYGRDRSNAPYPNYDDGYNAFSHQLPGYAPQGQFNMSPWAHGQQMPPHIYNRYGGYPMQGGYPNATGSGSPMNYGAYYPPAPQSGYTLPNNGLSNRSGFPVGVGPSQGTPGPPQVQTATSNTPVRISGNGHSDNAGPSPNAGNERNLTSAMRNLSFGSK